MTDADQRYMKRALRLARRGEGYVEPNPLVGCVIVREERHAHASRGHGTQAGTRIIGQGWHRRFGGPHAEVEALRRTGDAARGAVVYVTLEPCPHQGKTPPCSRALIEAGVGRVVIAHEDPTPGRAGLGIEQMRAAGIEVEVGTLRDEAADLLAPFLKRLRTGLPYVIAKWAATADGAIATRTGHSRWISNECSRRLVHRVRGRVDAIVAGIGTALADDPRLTARGVRPRRTARRVIIDPHLKLPADARLIRTLDAAPLALAISEAAKDRHAARLRSLTEAGVEIIALPTRSIEHGNGALDLRPLLCRLVEDHNATNVLIEGGGRTTGAFIEQGLVDELMVFVGPRLLGDPGAVPPVAFAAPVDRVDLSQRLRLIGMRRIGDDALLRYRLDNAEPSEM